jgi:hypothetical protein
VADSVSILAFDQKFRRKRFERFSSTSLFNADIAFCCSMLMLDSADERGHLKVGAIRLGQGVFDGVVGVIKKPMEGAAESGVKGLMKGIGRGIIGAAVKPVAGVADFASQTARAFTMKNESVEALEHISVGRRGSESIRC